MSTKLWITQNESKKLLNHYILLDIRQFHVNHLLTDNSVLTIF